MKNKASKIIRNGVLALAVMSSLFASSASWAYVSVRGYVRSNGTYVAPHIRTSPDGNPYNNFSYWD